MSAATDPTLFSPVPETAEAVLAGLDPEQRAVAEALHGPVCVLAGAGTGKTRALTHRIAYGVRTGVFAPASVLAVTFTARAAGEMRGRLRQLGAEGVQARTFHAAALRQLQFFWPRAVGGELPRLLDRKAQFVAEAAARAGVRPDRSELRDLTGEIEWAKVTRTVPEDYHAAMVRAARVPPRDPDETGRIYGFYEQLKRERSLIDFEDVLLLTVGVLQDRPDIAETVRGQYQHFVVDEYQDVNPLQQRLLELWDGGREHLCVVGDAGQTIYSFTGATPAHLLDFPARHPGATVVRLVRDYRSTPQVVNLANALLSGARGRAAEQRLELRSQREPGPEPVYREFGDEPAEAEGIARRVRERIDAGVPASGIAVLFRINAQSEVYEQALVDAGVPYQLRGAERFFERQEVQKARMALRSAARFGGMDTLLDGTVDLPSQVRAVLSGTGWSAEPPAGSGAARERWESLAALVRLAEALSADRSSSGGAEPELGDLVAELESRAAAQHAPTVEGVTLASLHSAKGLEWDAVFLAGLNEGMLPLTHARTDEEVEEERRLLYVGITRAREELWLSWSLARSPGGRAHREPSRFLRELRPGAVTRSFSGGTGGVERGGTARREAPLPRKIRGPAQCRVCGRSLTAPGEMKLMRCETCPSDIDEKLHERLLEWREQRAAELRQPAWCIFTDKTLTAIAETLPGDAAALSRIPGVGSRKLRSYGTDVLALCTDGASGGSGQEEEQSEGAPEDPSGTD